MNDIQYAARDGKLTIARLLMYLRQWPKLFVAIAVLTMATVITYSRLATPVYRSVVKTMPRQNDAAGGGLQSMLGQLSGLASLAGLSMSSVDEQEALAWLKSRALFTLFAKEQNILPILFSSQWDPVAQHWRPDVKHPPTMDDAWAMFDGSIRRVSEDPKTRVITLDITWRNRELAAAWANGLVRLANEELRARALRESAASVASFEEQLSHTEVVELRQSIYRLMEIQVNRGALAKSRPDYALTVIDPAVVSDERRFVSPRRFLMLVISVPLGLFLGACAVLAAQYARELHGQLRRLAVLPKGPRRSS